MPQRLSSRWTFYYKYVFPILWIPGFGLATLAVWSGSMNTGEQIPIEIKVFVVAAWILGSVIMLWLALRVKTVYLEGDRLLVSGGLKEVRIPLVDVAAISETRLWNPKMIKVSLTRTVEYTDHIVFLAPITFRLVFMDDPTAKDLRTRVEKAKRERTGFTR